MRIVRYLSEGSPRYGIVENGRVFPCDGNPYSGLKRLEEPLDPASLRLLAPVEPPNIICLGLNYRKHAEETGMNLPSEPLIFIKSTTALSNPGDPIVLPKQGPGRIDYEAELVIVIGKKAKDVPEENALDHVLGYTAAN